MSASRANRVGFVDYGKGLCIIMVVMMHSTLGVEAAFQQEGWLHPFVTFMKPFRIPDFFLFSGLFLALVIDRDWRTYLDRKVVHFAYFYLLWFTIQFAFKAPATILSQGVMAGAALYLEALIEPFGTLWFIYLLPIFFVVTKLTRNVHPIVIWPLAAALEILPIHTSWTVIDEFAGRFVYFYTGYILARPIFDLARRAQDDTAAAVSCLLLWALFNGLLVYHGLGELPGVSLGLGMLGVAAIVVVSALLAKNDRLPWLRYCGEHSIVIYLAFFLPMAATRTFLAKTQWIGDVGTVSAIVTVSAVTLPLVLYWAVRNTRLRFLFERPDRFWLAPKQLKPVLQPAE